MLRPGHCVPSIATYVNIMHGTAFLVLKYLSVIRVSMITLARTSLVLTLVATSLLFLTIIVATLKPASLAYAQHSLVGKWNIVEVIKNVSTTGTVTFTPSTFYESISGHTIIGTYTYTRGVLTLGGTQFLQGQAADMSGMSGMDSNNHIEFHTSDAVLHLMR
jgi:hypothetical protein